MLSEEEKFRFDLQGYLVIRGVLNKTECTALAEFSDSVWPRQPTDDAFRRTATSVGGDHNFST